tara:strand:- start:5253 stop:5444 length:192 start_codon:yes stop_codon:yes gene_type:complete
LLPGHPLQMVSHYLLKSRHFLGIIFESHRQHVNAVQPTDAQRQFDFTLLRAEDERKCVTPVFA